LSVLGAIPIWADESKTTSLQADLELQFANCATRSRQVGVERPELIKRKVDDRPRAILTCRDRPRGKLPMFQVRIHGRGGQGVVTGAEMLSVAAFFVGRHAQAFPSFGSAAESQLKMACAGRGGPGRSVGAASCVH
jgi:hypothetical protein